MLRGGRIKIFSVIFCSILFYTTSNAQDLDSLLKAATVTIITYDADGAALSKGCGFFINANAEIVTSRHVIAGSNLAKILTSNGKEYNVLGIVAEDKKGDLIKLVLDSIPANFQFLKIASTCSLEDKIYVLGPARGKNEDYRKYVSGEISGLRCIQNFGNIIQISAPVTAGFSGSPVINSRGEIVGITTFKVIRDKEFCFAVGTNRLAYFTHFPLEYISNWEYRRVSNGGSKYASLYAEAMDYLRHGYYSHALYRLNKVVDEYPLYVVAYAPIGYCNFKIGKWSDAIDAYYQALLVNPNDAFSYANLGGAYAKMERWGESMASYRQAIRLDSADLESWCGLGMAYVKLDNWNKARWAFRKAVAISPKSPTAHYGLGLSYWVSKNTKAAWYEYYVLKDLDLNLAEDLKRRIRNN